MKWLVSLVVASLVGAVLATKIFEVLFGGIIGPALVHAKNSVFLGTWTGITVGKGAHDIKKSASNLRKKK